MTPHAPAKTTYGIFTKICTRNRDHKTSLNTKFEEVSSSGSKYIGCRVFADFELSYIIYIREVWQNFAKSYILVYDLRVLEIA